MSYFIKKSTGLSGVKVEPNARAILSDLYFQTLKKLELIPASSGYRKNVESMTRFRLDTVMNETDILKIEEKIYGGQVEELIQQAKDELLVIDVVKKEKLWELKDPNKPPRVFFSNK
ncbi:NADH dehydrogenase [Tieghemostelium lacteum]|uniref:NADH dehydrogenase n=1 Tax=Tieghemostelium lacteum TaxID=361077 RepID=A0A151Z7P5_TIELA|nr:NADH dehydrogenase [Tieghemostelium lacteum]|eukprot:KYQ89980.1 NADH dehydrogenase [Tieghemostelium lacteum]